MVPLQTALLLSALLLSAQVDVRTQGADVVGRWQSSRDQAVVEISRCGPSVCGRLVGSAHLERDPDLRDARNRNMAQRDRRLRGLLLMQGFAAHGGEWRGGQIYDPVSGRSYRASMKMAAPDRLDVTACAAPLLCRTQSWRRLR